MYTNKTNFIKQNKFKTKRKEWNVKISKYFINFNAESRQKQKILSNSI